MKEISPPSEEAFLDAYGYSVKAPKPVKKDANAEGDFQYEINKKKEVTIVRYIGQDKCVSVPEQIEDGIVKAIGKEAFAENKNIEDVTIPECVDTIKGKAFSYCSNLKTIKLSNNISKIVKDTFEGCSNLTKINIPDNVTTIESLADKKNSINKLDDIGKKVNEKDNKEPINNITVITADDNLIHNYFTSMDVSWDASNCLSSAIIKMTKMDKENLSMI